MILLVKCQKGNHLFLSFFELLFCILACEAIGVELDGFHAYQ